jgi:thiol-disulfide isomerase/thioredoxin
MMSQAQRRLAALALTRTLLLGGPLAGLAACNEPATAEVPSRSRVEAVAAAPVTNADLDGFCDRRWSGQDGPLLALPAHTPSVGKATTWRWLNLWATWCKPCVSELPLLAAWEKAEKTSPSPAFSVVYLSVDDDEAALRGFWQRHPELPRGPRMLRPQELGTWLSSIGLGETATVPIQVIADANERIRCVRAGGLASHHLPIVKALLGQAR